MVRLTELDEIKLNNLGMPDDLDSLQSMLRTEGVDLTSPRFQQAIQKRLSVASNDSQSHSERTADYTKVRAFFMTMRDYSSILFNFIFIVIGLRMGLVLLFYAEVLSVNMGIETFLKNGASVIISLTLILMYFAIEWRLSVVYLAQGVPPKYAFTLYNVIKRLGYIFHLGFDKKDFSQELVDSNEYKDINRVRNVLIFLIVVLGILGRLDTLIETQSGDVWYQQIANIFTETNLKDFMSYIGGGSITLALLVATHYLIQYIAASYYMAVGKEEEFMSGNFFDGSQQVEILRDYYMYLLDQIWEKKKSEIMPGDGQNQNIIPANIVEVKDGSNTL